MFARLIVAGLATLSLTGCIAALPMVTQVASAPNSMSQLCSMAKLPGRPTTFCDNAPAGSASVPPGTVTGKAGTPAAQSKTSPLLTASGSGYDPPR
jgi:hypothetical protein